MALLGTQGFNLNLDRIISGEWSFDLSGGKSFIVSDDLTFNSPTKVFGIIDHIESLPNQMAIGMLCVNTATANMASGSNLMFMYDDGTCYYPVSLSNINGSFESVASLLPDGTSSLNVTTTNYKLQSTAVFDISNGNSFYCTNDITFTSVEQLFGIIDHIDIVSSSYGDVFAGFISKNTVSSMNSGVATSLNDDGTGVMTIGMSNPNGGLTDLTFLTAGGNTSRTISCTTLTLVTTLKYQNYKTGTLASPPSGLQINEVWADTTTSATHPSLRISTIAT